MLGVCQHIACYSTHYRYLRLRFLMIKYANRGLANDRYYWNMNWRLLKILFWVINISFLVINQGNGLAFYLKNGRSMFAYTYR